jgi:hypothetical protein
LVNLTGFIDMNAIAKLQEDVALRQAYQQQTAAEQQRREETQQQFTATVLGWDSDRQGYACKLPNGTVIYATKISATGADGVGDTVSLSQLQGRSIIRGQP